MDKKIIIIGGGVAGLTAATLLNQLGLKVTILEASDAIGGLAKSTRNYHNYPGEHSLRVYHRMYACLFNIYKQIPFTGEENETIFDQLVPVSLSMESDKGAYVFEVHENTWIKKLSAKIRLVKFLIKQGFTFNDFIHLLKQEIYARYSWEHFIKTKNIPLGQFTKNLSPAYHAIMGAEHCIAFAAMADTSSLLAIDFDVEAKPFDFFLMANGPTSEKTFDEWEKYLTAKKVEILTNKKVTRFLLKDNNINAVSLANGDTIEGDIFLCATSALDLRMLIEQSSLTEQIENFEKIRPYFSWAGGAQFYLSDLPDQNKPNNQLLKCGMLRAHLDSPWKLVSMIQGEGFWKKCVFPTGCRYVYSIAFNESDAPGILYNKSFLECNKDEILNELLAQVKFEDKHLIVDSQLNNTITIMKNDEYIKEKENLLGHIAHQQKNGDWILHFTPYYVPTVNDFNYAPEAGTKIPNLFLAGVHCKTIFFIPTMEKASESGFRAAISIAEALHLDKKINLPFKSYDRKSHTFFRVLDSFFYKFFQK